MSKFNLKIETNFIKYCMGKGEWGITLVELGKEWGRVIECVWAGLVRELMYMGGAWKRVGVYGTCRGHLRMAFYDFVTQGF